MGLIIYTIKMEYQDQNHKVTFWTRSETPASLDMVPQMLALLLERYYAGYGIAKRLNAIAQPSIHGIIV
jgi:hypothetical protein